MELVNCTEKYWEFVRKLRMDSRVEEGFVEKNKITKKMQIEYMKKNSIFYRVAVVEVINEKEKKKTSRFCWRYRQRYKSVYTSKLSKNGYRKIYDKFRNENMATRKFKNKNRK